MDDFESRLRNELGAAGRAVAATGSLDHAVRRRVRRRQAVAGAAAALPVALLAIGSIWMLGANENAADVDTFQPGPADPPTVAVSDPLHDALLDLGVEPTSAPVGTTALGGDEWCGVDDAFDDPNLESRQCLWEAWQAHSPAVGVLTYRTGEGAPIVEIHRMDEAGYIVRWIDRTQDEFSTETWSGPWYCSEFDVVDGEPVGANDCDSQPPGGFEDDTGTDTGTDTVFDQLALDGEPVTLVWPDQALFLDGQDTLALFLVSESQVSASQPTRWGYAGSATRNADGTTALHIQPPRAAALMEGSEFPPSQESNLPPGDYRLVTERDSELYRIELLEDPTGAVDLGGLFVEPGDAATPLLATGFGSYAWGSPADELVDAATAGFGEVVSDVTVEGCPTLRIIELVDGLTLSFGEGLERWSYRGTMWTTEIGIAVGSNVIDLMAVGATIHGSYDPNWGADRFQLEVFVGGTLSHDRTHPDAAVESLIAGRHSNPILEVC